jgi:hypothetical protein
VDIGYQLTTLGAMSSEIERRRQTLSLVAFTRNSASACAASTPIVFPPRRTSSTSAGSTLARRSSTSAVIYGGNTHLQPSVDGLSRSPDHWQLCTIVRYVAHVRIGFVTERKEENMMTSPLCFLLHCLYNSLKPPGTQASHRPYVAERLLEQVRKNIRRQNYSWIMG